MTENETRSLPENDARPLKPDESYQPIVSAEARMPELTPRSIIWGIVLCVIFTVASAYTGLKVGQVMEAAIPISSAGGLADDRLIGFDGSGRRECLSASTQVLRRGAYRQLSLAMRSTFKLEKIHQRALKLRCKVTSYS
jgi:hypothetical protein